MTIATTSQMRAIDEMAIQEMGIPSLELMEHAAERVTEAVVEQMRRNALGNVVVICGTGNNGGDGLACARQLLSKGISVTTILVGDPQKQTADSRVNTDALLKCGGMIQRYSGGSLPECSLIVDAIFGFGLNRQISGVYQELIEKINAHPAPVIACDIPSGLHGDTGDVMGTAVKAAQTVCFTCAKPGLLKEKSAPYVGQLRVVEIGIPLVCLERHGVCQKEEICVKQK